MLDVSAEDVASETDAAMKLSQRARLAPFLLHFLELRRRCVEVTFEWNGPASSFFNGEVTRPLMLSDRCAGSWARRSNLWQCGDGLVAEFPNAVQVGCVVEIQG